MKILRKIGLATLLIGMPVAALGQTSAVGPAAAATSSDHSSLLLESGTGRVLTLREPAANVFVADPKIAEVRPASAAALFVFGVAAGRTTVAALDAAGHTIAQYDVTVQPSAFGAIQTQSLIARLVAGSRVQVQAQSKGLLLSGVVGSAADAAQAVAIAKGYVGDAQIVENQISVASPIQVTLRVRIAEISREVVRNLGVNWQAIGTIGSIAKLPALNLAANGVGAASCAAGTLFSLSCQGGNFNAVIDALASGQPGARPGRTEPDRDERPARELPGRRPVPHSGRPAEQRDLGRLQELSACRCHSCRRCSATAASTCM